jgi:hypothetical protein
MDQKLFLMQDLQKTFSNPLLDLKKTFIIRSQKNFLKSIIRSQKNFLKSIIRSQKTFSNPLLDLQKTFSNPLLDMLDQEKNFLKSIIRYAGSSKKLSQNFTLVLLELPNPSDFILVLQDHQIFFTIFICRL